MRVRSTPGAPRLIWLSMKEKAGLLLRKAPIRQSTQGRVVSSPSIMESATPATSKFDLLVKLNWLIDHPESCKSYEEWEARKQAIIAQITPRSSNGRTGGSEPPYQSSNL